MQSVAQALAEENEAWDKADGPYARVEKGIATAMVRSRLWISLILVAGASYYALFPVIQEATRRADEAYLADVVEDEAKRIGRAAGKGNLAIWIQNRELSILRNFYRSQSEKLVSAVKRQGFEQATAANVGIRVDFDARMLVVSAQFGGPNGELVSAAVTTEGKRVGHPLKETGIGTVLIEQSSVIGGTFALVFVLIIPMFIVPFLASRRERPIRPKPALEVPSGLALDELPPEDS